MVKFYLRYMGKIFTLCASLILIASLLYPGSTNPIKKYLLGPTHVHKTIYVSSTFDDYEFVLAKEAAAEWKKETHGLVSIDIVYGFDSETYRSISHDPDSMIMVRAAPDDPLVISLDNIVRMPILGYYMTQFETQAILVVPGRMLGDDYYRSVMIHEMGHSIGLSHIKEDENTIMYESVSETYHLTKKDIQWFCRAYYCNANKLGGR